MSGIYPTYVKRGLDILFSGVGLLVASPLLLLTALALAFANKGAGVFFIQERPGRGGRIFRIIKFKTMTDEKDAQGRLLPNKDRITPVGKIVRAASLDEIPQLINVFKGDMSLIGPRPLLVWFLPLYTPEQARRHEVRPGITGWAQVNGRNNATYSRKFKLDVWYVDHACFKLDCLILWMTIKNTLSRKDIGNGNQDNVDDLGWAARRQEAEQIIRNSRKQNR